MVKQLKYVLIGDVFMNNFENDSRRKQELKGRPIADLIYIKNWGLIDIKRYERDDNLILDQKFCIDITITMPNGMILNGQEKFLSFKYAKYASLTIEYMQNFKTEERGDWFKLASQFYFCGYLNKNQDEFVKYILTDWTKFVIYTNKNKLRWNLNENKDGKAKASFKYIYFTDVPNSFIIDKKF